MVMEVARATCAPMASVPVIVPVGRLEQVVVVGASRCSTRAAGTWPAPQPEGLPALQTPCEEAPDEAHGTAGWAGTVHLC